VAVFSGGAPDANLQADVAGLVHALMNQLGVG
jgi:hypothetical protein